MECIVCGTDKSNRWFPKIKTCEKCYYKKRNKEYYLKNREKTLAKQNEYVRKKRELLTYKKPRFARSSKVKKEKIQCVFSSCSNTSYPTYCQKHKHKDPRVIAYKKEHRFKNIERYNKLRKEYYYVNKSEIDEYRKQYRIEKLKTDINYKIRRALRKRFYMALKSNLKGGSAIRDLGCSIEDFKAYIELKFKEGMTWENWGRGRDKWHIDHIIPLSSFDLSNPDEVKKACHYTNLQPLWELDNLKKSRY